METQQKEQPKTAQEPVEVEFTNAYYLKGIKLEQVITNKENANKILETDVKERKFRTGGELGGIILNNGKQLFGEGTYLLDCAEKKSIIFPGDFIPHGLLIDVRDKEKPKLYFIEAMLAKENTTVWFSRMTNIFYFFSNHAHTAQFLTILENAIMLNIGWRNKLKPVFGDKPPIEFLQQMLLRKPDIILATDAMKPEIVPFTETYTDTWGKMIKQVIFKKFDVAEDILLTMSPTFADLNAKASKSTSEKKTKKTEDDHLADASDVVKEIYHYLKAELLKADSTLEFRIKGHYISLRKNRNLAFFQLGRKKLTIVLANPENGMREQLKHHEIRTLADSVKKFWNGNEDCFTVVIERKEHLDDVLILLKKLAGIQVINGSEIESKATEQGKEMKTQSKPRKAVKTGKKEIKPKARKK